jgi:hypothetical protein
VDKYYIPKLEEFHIGFEYEELCKNFHYHKLMKPEEDVYEWINIKFDTSKSFSTISSKIKQDKIRVKYLDDNDIESFNFNFNIVPNCFKDDEPLEDGYSFDVDENNTIILHINDDKLTIGRQHIYSKLSDNWYFFPLFNGIIKNKSELKVLLTQLNII